MSLALPGLAHALLLVVAAQRLAELAWSRHNESRLLALGAVESAAHQHGWFVALHAGWLASMAAASDWEAPLNPYWLAVYFVLQAMRVWILYSLGYRWTTRILAVPGLPLVRKGPYRLLAHPNYVLVAWELVALPLALGLWLVALVASLANLPLTCWRISAEERALGRAVGGRP
jgi:methyltransferase